MTALDLTTLVLKHGNHRTPEQGMCLLEKAKALLGTRTMERTEYKTDVFIRLFARCIESETGCWEWQGHCNSDGYGAISLNRQSVKTHRIAWTLIFGELGELHVCHKCDNPKCCNPRHLFLGTNRDNMIDRQAKGRTKNIQAGQAKRHAALRAVTHCPKGHPYSGENLRVRPSGNRRCAECYRIRTREYIAANRDLINQRRRARRAAKGGVS